MSFIKSTRIQSDPHHKEEIAGVIQELQRSNVKITFTRIIADLEQSIVNSYKKEINLESHKSNWIKRIKSVAALLNVTIQGSSKNKMDWTNIMKRIDILDDDLKTCSSICESTESISTDSNSMSSANSLAESQKMQILKKFENLDHSKMWVLSNGTVVELQMQKLAIACIYEHPCHSLIMDPDDTNWEEYFDKNELKEIREYNQTSLQPLSKEITEYLRSFASVHSVNELYLHAFSKVFDPLADPDSSWIQFAMAKSIRLFLKQSEIDFDILTEADVLKAWDFITNAFDSSKITVISGEKMSSSTAIGKNKQRKLEAIDQRRRYASGSKVDLLFKSKDKSELGCCEVGKGQNDNSTKELDDRTKQLKTLKEMLARLVYQSPALIHQLKTVGFTIMGPKINMIYVDCPAGYVSRVTRTVTLHFPTDLKRFSRMMPPLISLVMNGKNVMEHSLDLLENDQSHIEIGFTTGANSCHLPATFWNSKHLMTSRKRSCNTTSSIYEEQ
ncbi:hypothetical protein CLU79DRAFT_773810 [Phycomyces nitens]|nr:hypothetical protein CLU79DRAFT_773810 [Phycomyces nitens]